MARTANDRSIGDRTFRVRRALDRFLAEDFRAASFSLDLFSAMLRLKQSQRAVLADKLPDAANVVAAGLVVGQAVSGRPFSLALALLGIGLWAALMIMAVLLAPKRRDRD